MVVSYVTVFPSRHVLGLRKIAKISPSFGKSSIWFSAIHVRNRTWKALHCQSIKHKLKKSIWVCA